MSLDQRGANVRKELSPCPESSPYEETQLLARLTVLERVVGTMVREAMLQAGKGPQDILNYGEAVKAFFKGRTPEGASDHDLEDAADKFFSAIASDIGSRSAQDGDRRCSGAQARLATADGSLIENHFLRFG